MARGCAQHDKGVCALWRRGTERIALGLPLRHSARSRGIQEPRIQSVLQAFLDAATARSMTGGCAVWQGGAPCGRGDAQHDGCARVMTRRVRAAWRRGTHRIALGLLLRHSAR